MGTLTLLLLVLLVIIICPGLILTDVVGGPGGRAGQEAGCNFMVQGAESRV